ncbi:selenocysteine-specific translation elongation factor [Klebsiella pneumoniae subsp. ozaenae]|uniref:Selenocysteine-specific translation elongation factor n=1 Tax=Klebsiella pneumoniae subsp. ozaenae TaxID=574 RepID=A0A377YW32_KLEPO|nr:selenocysteine-specific translation elongation factor [Klebsiella pneumoniae subsp. ozaenae]
MSLLEDNLAELVLDTPLWLADNDRLVLRDISARLTLAGARVVTLDPPRRGKRKPEYLQWLHALAAVGADDAQALESCICSGMPSGLSTSPGRGSSAKPEWRP